jgi:hypothetical protein
MMTTLHMLNPDLADNRGSAPPLSSRLKEATGSRDDHGIQTTLPAKVFEDPMRSTDGVKETTIFSGRRRPIKFVLLLLCLNAIQSKTAWTPSPQRQSSLIISAAFSATAYIVEQILFCTLSGNPLASTVRRLAIPYTFNLGSTTPPSSLGSMAHVPIG